jgi:hypothetical protein
MKKTPNILKNILRTLRLYKSSPIKNQEKTFKTELMGFPIEELQEIIKEGSIYPNAAQEAARELLAEKKESE